MSLPPLPADPPATVFDDPGDIAPETTRRAAFHHRPEWKGRPLNGLSISMLCLFHELRESVGAPRLARTLEGGTFLADAMRILWICSADEDTLEAAAGNLPRAAAAVRQWTEANVTIRDQIAAVETALSIWNSAHENEAEPQPGEGGGALPGK
jgi:hypothetical protein